MGKGAHLGEFEHVVLLAVAALGEDAYGMRIRGEIRERIAREVSVPTVYAALDRLERKGMVMSRLGDPSPQRGGRAKKVVSLTSGGHAALAATRKALESMWAWADARGADE